MNKDLDEFPEGSFGIVFFSRGRGRGHVLPDISIMDAIEELQPNIKVRWVSYSTGADTLREFERDVYDLDFSDHNPFLATQLRAVSILSRLKPQLVIAHEEFAAMPAAKMLGLPTLFIVDYFLRPDHLWMECLRYADEIVFIDEPGYFETPQFLLNKVFYTGKFVRKFKCTQHDRERSRIQLDLESDTSLILVFSGDRPEAEAPIFDLVIPAYRSLPLVNKRLLWIAGKDSQHLKRRLNGYQDIIVNDFVRNIDPWISACDLAITKATRKISLELAAFAKPSISISHRVNFVDDIRVGQITTNTHLNASEIDEHTLGKHMKRLLESRFSSSSVGSETYGLMNGVIRIADHIRQLSTKC
ncbi:UDP-N-acetylglucosamine:LPS N-acetylglucosamine transferase [Edaphobacter aggregans]|uniref:UDP-N-acetylglucosamine:LPS N-acetylglucosamine transferase n=1 Tax=Edaphobacter aggregans TaxID=570835 RepID=A0A3R9QDE1_9BACT|nr:hypothetical protein [Edaphobacter aggregans]RSL18644.1 UDP-N-acetylglucosamine:LPS N-acetylglucosamine transferase [Edaphobacter aggregans]